jgi:hypothetical protein
MHEKLRKVQQKAATVVVAISLLQASLAPNSRAARARSGNDGGRRQSVGKRRERAQLPPSENLHSFRITLWSHHADKVRLR